MTMDAQNPNPQLQQPKKPTKNPALKAALSAEAAAEAAELKSQLAATSAKKTNKAKAIAFLQAFSFKEETNLVSDLTEAQTNALHQLKSLLSAHANTKAEETPLDVSGASKASEDCNEDNSKHLESLSSAPAEETPKEAPLDVAVDSEAPKTSGNVNEDTEKSLESLASVPDAEAPKEVTLDVSVDFGASVDADEDGAKTVEAIAETVVVNAQESVKKEDEVESKPAKNEEVMIWGVPVLGDERSDTVLLKFLRARDFKAKEALEMINAAVKWREEFGVEKLLEEDLGVPELDKVVFMHGVDRDGHPVCYNVYGELQRKEVYELAFADEEKRRRFLRWRIQFLEKGIRNLLNFSLGGVSSMVQVIDLKNSVGLGKKELRQALALLQDNYPEFAAKQIFINVPWWYLAFNRMISPFFTQRTKSKFVFAGPSKSAETLFKYIAPEQVPVQYGGLSKEKDPDFTIVDAVIEINIKPSTKQVVEIPVEKECLLVWELRVIGWDVNYSAEFVPNSKDGYTVIIQKARKITGTEQPVLNDSYKIREAGKVVITVNNTSSKKKQLLYRCKTKSSQGKN